MSKKMKRLYKPKDFYRLLQDLSSSAGATRRLPKEERISKLFQERIMMAVTEVNGCQYCSFFHTRVALQAGMAISEIQRVLEGDFEDAPQDQLAALYFAQYYAETAGIPNDEAQKYLLDQYGANRAGAIIAYIRAIMVGNAWGNMLDALRSRMTGDAYSGVSLWDELGVITGPFFMIPAIMIRKLFIKGDLAG